MKTQTTLSTLLCGLLLLCCVSVPAFGQNKAAESHNVAGAAMPEGKTLVFRFLGDDDMFYIPFAGNDGKLQELFATVEHYKQLITDGIVKINVTGYSSGLATHEENLASAKIRANRVKSELITGKGLTEDHFITANRASSFDGWKSAVVVTIRVPQIETPVQERPKPAPRPEPEKKPEPKPEPVVEKQPEPVVVAEPAAPAKPYCFAVRTNLLYDAFLVPTLGVEWRVNESLGIKLDGSLSWWGGETGKVQKMWLVNPEMRWYMLENKRFYVGVGGNFGEYNIYGGMLDGLFSKDTGYQGKLWGAGVTVGYQLRLARSFSLDFNLGLGYTSLDYDSFTVTGQTRVYKAKNQTKNFWGPTQAGVNLVWTIGGKK